MFLPSLYNSLGLFSSTTQINKGINEQANAELLTSENILSVFQMPFTSQVCPGQVVPWGAGPPPHLRKPLWCRIKLRIRLKTLKRFLPIFYLLNLKMYLFLCVWCFASMRVCVSQLFPFPLVSLNGNSVFSCLDQKQDSILSEFLFLSLSSLCHL